MGQAWVWVQCWNDALGVWGFQRQAQPAVRSWVGECIACHCKVAGVLARWLCTALTVVLARIVAFGGGTVLGE